MNMKYQETDAYKTNAKKISVRTIMHILMIA